MIVCNHLSLEMNLHSLFDKKIQEVADFFLDSHADQHGINNSPVNNKCAAPPPSKDVLRHPDSSTMIVRSFQS
jgi:hypothetical protein